MACVLVLVLPFCGPVPAFAQAEPTPETAPPAATPQESQAPASLDDGAAIAKKYSPGGEHAAQAAAYQQRVKELSATVVATARGTWIASAFPIADVVIGAFSTDAERLATPQILLDLLEFRVNPSPPPAVEKKNGYRRAIARISPPAQYDASLFAATKRLGDNPQFRLDVVNRFVPAFAADAARGLSAAQYQREARGNLFWLAFVRM